MQGLVRASTRPTAYFNLLEGNNADLLIVGEANDEVMARKEGAELRGGRNSPLRPMRFVFVVNEDNPVDSITVEQARDILLRQDHELEESLAASIRPSQHCSAMKARQPDADGKARDAGHAHDGSADRVYRDHDGGN